MSRETGAIDADADADAETRIALAAYRWAWADGQPYVHRYEPLPFEAQVEAAIELLRAEKDT